MIIIKELREYLVILEKIIDNLENLPCLDNKADDYYFEILEKTKTEFQRVFKILKRNEEKQLLNLINNDIIYVNNRKE